MMTPPIPHHTHRPIDPSLGGTLVYLGLLVAAVAFVANPLLTTALVLGAVVGLRALSYGVTTLVRRLTGKTQEFSIPGVGTVEYRITPR